MPAFFLEIIPNFLITKISLREFSTTFRNEPGKDLETEIGLVVKQNTWLAWANNEY